MEAKHQSVQLEEALENFVVWGDHDGYPAFDLLCQKSMCVD